MQLIFLLHDPGEPSNNGSMSIHKLSPLMTLRPLAIGMMAPVFVLPAWGLYWCSKQLVSMLELLVEQHCLQNSLLQHIIQT